MVNVGALVSELEGEKVREGREDLGVSLMVKLGLMQFERERDSRGGRLRQGPKVSFVGGPEEG